MGRKTIVFVLISLFSLYIFVLLAPKASAAFDCLTITTSSSESEKNYCKNELAQIEAELQDLLNKQKEQQKQTGTLKGDVEYLTAQINALKTKIKARVLAIAQLKVNITEKVNTIKSLSTKIDREYESLAQLLRNTNEFDNETLVHLILSDESVSNFYSDLESYASIKQAVKDSVDVIKGVKTQTEVAKQDLEKKQDAETDAKAELENAQKGVAKSEADKKELLAISKEKEAAYQQLAAQKKIQADKIRAALFPLAGISQKIDFGTALSYADEVQKATGIDPAFLLAVITQESRLGANVGQCNIPNTPSWDKIMPGPTEYQTYLKNGKTCKNSKSSCSSRDDQTPFQNIVDSLDMNTYGVPLSCPILSAGPWGGAMGPAQFIPSTWSGYISRLKNLLGHYASPWNPRDAFFASATMLTDKGAIGNSASAQNKAACAYYGTGGSSCSYSRSVMGLKAKIQADIDLL